MPTVLFWSVGVHKSSEMALIRDVLYTRRNLAANPVRIADGCRETTRPVKKMVSESNLNELP
jgi:hypothetical protein